MRNQKEKRKTVIVGEGKKEMYYFQLYPPEICSETKHQKGKYKPQIVALAEGFTQLGRVIGANIDYYKVSLTSVTPRFLIEKKPFRVEDVKCLIVSADMLYDCDVPTKNRIQACQLRRVPIIAFDWIASRFFCTNQAMILGSCDRFMYYAHVPELRSNNKIDAWPIGFTQRVVDVCREKNVPFAERKNVVLWSHRVPHHIRKTVWDTFYSTMLIARMDRFNDLFERPKQSDFDTMMNYQTGNRHNVNFYQALCSVKMVDCCGGFFVTNGVKPRTARVTPIASRSTNIIRQWDSFLLWEGFVSGCCVITLDLEYYGFLTGATEEPKNMIHYIGLRLDQPEYMRQLADDILNDRIDIESIASAGHDWAIKYFSPEARATSFEQMIAK